MDIRFVTPYTRVVYLRQDDVLAYLSEVADGMPTDERLQLTEAILLLSRVGPQNAKRIVQGKSPVKEFTA